MATQFSQIIYFKQKTGVPIVLMIAAESKSTQVVSRRTAQCRLFKRRRGSPSVFVRSLINNVIVIFSTQTKKKRKNIDGFAAKPA